MLLNAPRWNDGKALGQYQSLAVGLKFCRRYSTPTVLTTSDKTVLVQSRTKVWKIHCVISQEPFSSVCEAKPHPMSKIRRHHFFLLHSYDFLSRAAQWNAQCCDTFHYSYVLSDDFDKTKTKRRPVQIRNKCSERQRHRWKQPRDRNNVQMRLRQTVTSITWRHPGATVKWVLLRYLEAWRNQQEPGIFFFLVGVCWATSKNQWLTLITWTEQTCVQSVTGAEICQVLVDRVSDTYMCTRQSE